MDVASVEARSRLMSRIRGRDTKPELAVRSAAHSLGLRFRLNGCGLPGRPDLVLRRHGAAIFVHGCFWHQHRGCRHATVPTVRQEYWLPKLARNIERDRTISAELGRRGWKVLTIWECELRNPESVKVRLQDFLGPTRLPGPRSSSEAVSTVSTHPANGWFSARGQQISRSRTKTGAKSC